MFCQKRFFSAVLQCSGGKCLTSSLNRFDLALLANILYFHGGLKETEIHCSRDSQSLCQEKLLSISPKALRSRDGGGEFPADASLLLGKAVNPQVIALSTIRSDLTSCSTSSLANWLITQVQGFFYS